MGEVGLGCWQMGGDWGPVSEETAFLILEAALESGVDFWDTANVYGAGRSESLIGRFLKERRAKVFVATKLGRGEIYPNGYTREAVRDRGIAPEAGRRGPRSDAAPLHPAGGPAPG